MSAAILLGRLEKVRQTGPGRWLACCPAHDDRRASLSIRELDDGRVLLHDFAGCAVQQVVAAVDLNLSDLFPPSGIAAGHGLTGERRPFPASDVLRAIAHEATIIAIEGARLGNGHPLSDDDRARVLLAAERIRTAVDESGHG